MGASRQNWTNYMMLGRKNSEGGFTLIEIMIAVAILGIGSAIAVPSYIQWNARYQLRQATSELQSNLVQARMVAKNRNTAMAAAFIKAADGSYSVIFGGGLAPMTLPRSVTGGSMILVTALGPPPTTAVTDFALSAPGDLGAIQFNQQGLRVAGGIGNQAVTLQSVDGTTFSVVVAPSGKVNWCKNSMITCP
jgi:prepilin-type N-terminal cleavage/methylation domain-containing protein